MDLTAMLEGALMDGMVECENCGNSLEPDADMCSCGWKNPLVSMGCI